MFQGQNNFKRLKNLMFFFPEISSKGGCASDRSGSLSLLNVSDFKKKTEKETQSRVCLSAAALDKKRSEEEHSHMLSEGLWVCSTRG